MTISTSIPLGQKIDYPEKYDPNLLFPIARLKSRLNLSRNTIRPLSGEDIWTGYEISWLNQKGKPEIAIGTFVFSKNTENILESKSFKLYLNSLNFSYFKDIEEVQKTLQLDLENAAKGDVKVILESFNSIKLWKIKPLEGELLDLQDIEINEYIPNARLLSINNKHPREESRTWISHLLKSNCPVTGQPDWADIQISYTGLSIDPAQLLRYLISFRRDNNFHEHCVEKIFDDILYFCQPKKLFVYARYTRRGGLDINPWRSTEKNQEIPKNFRTCRQ